MLELIYDYLQIFLMLRYAFKWCYLKHIVLKFMVAPYIYIIIHRIGRNIQTEIEKKHRENT